MTITGEAVPEGTKVIQYEYYTGLYVLIWDPTPAQLAYEQANKNLKRRLELVSELNEEIMSNARSLVECTFPQSVWSAIFRGLRRRNARAVECNLSSARVRCHLL